MADLEAARMISTQTGLPVAVDHQPPAQATVEQQQAILSRAKQLEANGISIDLLNSSRLTPLLARARAEGIQLAVFDSESPTRLQITSVGNDYCKQARIAVQRLVKLLGGRGEVAIMQGVPTAPLPRHSGGFQRGDQTAMAQGYWQILSLWQQQLGAPAIERINTGMTLAE